jgi:hypothetical protein
MFLRKLWPEKKWLRVVIVTAPIVVILIIVTAIIIFSTGENDLDYIPAVTDNTPIITEPPPEQLPEPEPEPEPEPPAPPEPDPYETTRWDYPEEEPIDPRPRSFLTGLPIEEDYLNRRPIAVVINNIHRAHPQSGITSADIIYEVLAEGDITRLVGIFQSYIPEKIGPVRSARDSFIDFAFNHDAIFVHHGRSPDADTRLRNTRVANLDGMALEGTVFWRDRTYPDWHHNTGSRPLEHSSYTSWQRMFTHIDSRGIRDYINEDFVHGFTFGEVPENPNGGIANSVTVPFSVPYIRTFIFEPETGLYFVEYRDGPLKDAETAEQVTVTNILIQQTTKRVTGSLGQRTIGTVGEGNGFLVTGGTYRPVRWAKDSHTSPMRWYFEDGSPIVLAPGVTWICVFQVTGTVTFE